MNNKGWVRFFCGILCVGLAGALSGCIFQKINPFHVYGGEDFGSFQREHIRVLKELPCTWVGESDPYDVNGYDFVCDADTWGTMSLMMDQEDGGLTRIRLVWEDYSQGAHLQPRQDVAESFVEFIAKNYLGNKDVFLKEVFFGKHDNSFASAYLNFDYRYDEETDWRGHALHRLEITKIGQKVKEKGFKAYE